MNNEFKVHKLDDEGLIHMKEIAESFNNLLNGLENIKLEGRYLSIVKTKLEEACFFAKKGIAINYSS